jgi:hypothetical protein
MLSSRTLRRSASIATQAARMSRVRSQSTIYMPPPSNTSRSLSRASSVSTIIESAPQSSTAAPPGKKLTPGRRGEKRKRPLQQQLAEDEEKRRRSGKIAVDGNAGNADLAAPEFSKRSSGNGSSKMQGTRQTAPDPSEIVTIDDDDIFGNVNSIGNGASNQSISTKPKSLAISECETRNKAVGVVMSLRAAADAFHSRSKNACLRQWRREAAAVVIQNSKRYSAWRTRVSRLHW